MLYRPVDTDLEHEGDMVAVHNPDIMLSGEDAVLASVNSRLRLLAGEWWEDESLGFLVPSFLYDGVRMPEGPVILANYITSYIAQTEGVQAVKNVESVVDGRKLLYSCTLETEYGEVEGSVTQDVLLRAIY